MIDFIEKNQRNNVEIVEDAKITTYDLPLMRVLHRYARMTLTSIVARIEATKKQFHWQSKVPIYLGKDLLLIPIKSLRSPHTLLVNFYAIKSTQKKSGQEIEIIFIDSIHKTVGKENMFRKQLMRCHAIDLFILESESK